MYEALLRSYRETPENPNAAAKIAGCDHRTARRGLEDGWPRYSFRPIREVLAEEEAAARARRYEIESAQRKREADEYAAFVVERARRQAAEAQASAEVQVVAKLAEAQVVADRQAKERIAAAEAEARSRIAELTEHAQSDAIEQRAEEALICHKARKNVLAAQSFVARTWQHAKTLAEQVQQAIESGALTPAQAFQFARDMIRATREVNEATKLALEIERLRVGDPTQVVGIRLEAEPATLEEATRDIEHAAHVLDLVRRGLPTSDTGNGANNGAADRDDGEDPSSPQVH